MHFNKIRILICGILLAIGVGASQGAADEQRESRPAVDALQQDILSELRTLRLALESVASIQSRIQVTLARLAMQEQRAAHLSMELAQVRQQLAAAMLESNKLSVNADEVESKLQNADNDTRAYYESAQALGRRKLTQQTQIEQQLKDREAQTVASLAAEQAKWAALNAQLDELVQLFPRTPGR